MNTEDLHKLYNDKTALLQEWEASPTEVQVANAEYIAKLIRRVRQLRCYLEHRKDCPLNHVRKKQARHENKT